MSCEKHDGCDYGCGGCNWDATLEYAKQPRVSSNPDLQKGFETYSAGWDAGVDDFREKAIKKLESYLELNRFSEVVEGATLNPDWDAGFQAALGLLKGTKRDEE